MTADPLLRRFERAAAIACACMALGALAVTRGRLDAAASVLGGGLLTAIAYWAIRSSVDGVLAAPAAAAGAPRRRFAWILVKLAGRYALLAFLAYVMIARLRLHPLGLMAGASSAVAAAAIEAVRFLVKQQRSDRLRRATGAPRRSGAGQGAPASDGDGGSGGAKPPR